MSRQQRMKTPRDTNPKDWGTKSSFGCLKVSVKGFAGCSMFSVAVEFLEKTRVG